MKHSNKLFISIALMLIFLVISCSKREISSDQLQERNGIYYVINKDKPYSGKVIATYDNEQRRFEKEYKDGRLNGVSVNWYSNGQNKSEISYKAGKQSGTFKKWYENGQQTAEGSYNDNKKDGKWANWYSNGKKESEIEYTNGKLNGLSTEWYSNGKKESEIDYKAGKQSGTYKTWYENGQQTINGSYKNSELYGKWTYWYSSGQKKKEKEYADGNLNGLSIEWYNNGNKKSEIFYTIGRQTGTYKTWRENGQQTAEGSYKDSKKDGKWIHWYSNGQKEKEGEYQLGKQMNNWNYWTLDGWKIGSPIKDIDGNTYKTIKIGNQIWMAENLKVTRYRNGDPLKPGTYCNYENSTKHATVYGRLYNWYAVDKRGLALKGWHIPTYTEFKELINYLGTNAADKMKESGTIHWKKSNKEVTNKSGFSALPGGDCDTDGAFINDIGFSGSWWSSSSNRKFRAYHLHLSSLGVSLSTDFGKLTGLSVRCIRD